MNDHVWEKIPSEDPPFREYCTLCGHLSISAPPECRGARIMNLVIKAEKIFRSKQRRNYGQSK